MDADRLDELDVVLACITYVPYLGHRGIEVRKHRDFPVRVDGPEHVHLLLDGLVLADNRRSPADISAFGEFSPAFTEFGTGQNVQWACQSPKVEQKIVAKSSGEIAKPARKGLEDITRPGTIGDDYKIIYLSECEHRHGTF